MFEKNKAVTRIRTASFNSKRTRRENRKNRDVTRRENRKMKYSVA